MSAPEQSTESKVRLPRGKRASCSLHLCLETFSGCFCSLARVDYAKAHLRECQQSTGWGRCSGYLTDVMTDCQKIKARVAYLTIHPWPLEIKLTRFLQSILTPQLRLSSPILCRWSQRWCIELVCKWKRIRFCCVPQLAAARRRRSKAR